MSLFDIFKNKEVESESSLSESQEEIIQEEKQDMIEGVEGLSSTTVKEVMIPRIDVDFISSDCKKDELIEKIIASGHSRFPVYSESTDNVVGVLYVKDLLKAIANNEEIDILKIVRKPYFVPESKIIHSLLREFKRRHLHIAIAIDEYGGISGIVTMEDIIEEIVGDIQDEFDKENEDIIFINENSWLCDARINLSDLNETIETQFPEEDFDSLGGFVFDLFGKVPVKFEKVCWNNFEFIIQAMDGHRINLVKIIKNVEESKDE
ncbi:MAG: HlyC/CorC family transporter [Treponema sp.]|nr:HlyC/CorC family transporter [Treponema sp.]MBO5482901.1 HlyC/CorC family transporter [Spirochaetaceae bacterium]